MVISSIYKLNSTKTDKWKNIFFIYMIILNIICLFYTQLIDKLFLKESNIKFTFIQYFANYLHNSMINNIINNRHTNHQNNVNKINKSIDKLIKTIVII